MAEVTHSGGMRIAILEEPQEAAVDGLGGLDGQLLGEDGLDQVGIEVAAAPLEGRVDTLNDRFQPGVAA